MNEKEYVEGILRDKNIEPSRAGTFLSLYARYLYHEGALKKSAIIKEMNRFMEQCFPRYNPADWSAALGKYADRAGRYPLCQCSGIWVTENELKAIESLHDKVLERLAFTLLCLAKFGNFRNPDNHDWVCCSNGEIFSMACINIPAFEKDIRISRLKDLGLIKYAKKVNNLSIQVLYADASGENRLFLSDFRKLGYEWRLYKGENYIRCAGCAVLIKNTNGKKRYCKECADAADREKAKIRMKKIREI